MNNSLYWIFNQLIKGNHTPKIKGWSLEKVSHDEFTNRFLKKWNIGPGDALYRLYKNGELVSDKLFMWSNAYCTKDLNDGRYLILRVAVEEKYSKEICKCAGVRSPYHFEGKECVFDKEKERIVYVCSGEDCHLTIYDNILICTNHRGGAKFILLPQETQILALDSYDMWTTSLSLYIKSPKYKEADNIIKVDRFSGEIRKIV